MKGKGLRKFLIDINHFKNILKMKTKFALSVFLVLLLSTGANAQLGIRGGVNMANEPQSFNSQSISQSFQSNNLTGYKIGLVYEMNPKNSGFGFEVGALFTQSGSTFKMDSSSVVNSIIKGYHEINYLEVPLNLRFRIGLGGLAGIFGTAGIFGGYTFSGKTTFESDTPNTTQEDAFDKFMDRIDYGYSYGFGVEILRKIQVGANWNKGLQKRDASKSLLDKIKTESNETVPNLESKSSLNSFTVSLTYLF